jgi:hypothetical protein
MGALLFVIVPGTPLGGLWVFLKLCRLRENREARVFHSRVTAAHVPATNPLIIDGYSGRPYPTV